MKITPALVAISLTAILPLSAKDEKKPADSAKPAENAAPNAEGADAAWAEVEPLLKGPAVRPKTQDEAKDVYKAYLAEFDEKSEAFIKAHPTDVRRWKLKVHELQINRMRTFAGLEAKSDDEVNQSITEIIEAKDADKESRGFASFMRVMESAEKPDDFKKMADAHIKDFPDFRGNRQIESQLKTMETEKAIKEKPLELSFTSTDGKEIDLSKMRGKVVLVDFWATWCGPCVAELPNVIASYKKLHDKGFEIVGISFDQDKDKLMAMTKDKGMTWPQYFDGEGWKNKFGQQFGISSIPTMWLVDKKGMVVDTRGREDLEKKVEKLLAE